MKKSIRARRLTALIGGATPLLLVAYAYRLHGMADFARDSGVLRRDLLWLGFAGVLALVALGIDLAWRRKTGWSGAAAAGFVWVVGAGSLLMAVFFAGYVFIPKYTGGGDIPPQLILLNTPAAGNSPGLAVSFYTARATKNTLLWGEADGKLKHLSEAARLNRHWFELGGLKADTSYMYTVNDGPTTFFRTPPPAGDTVWFAAAGDAHIGNSTSDREATKRMLASIARPTNGYSMFFDLGDTAQLGFDRDIWRQAGQVFSPKTGSIPTAYVPGNHDTLLGGADLYRRYLGVRAPGGEDEPLWRRIDVSGVHFLLLDLEWELGTYVPAQKAWLTAQLKSIPARDWTIVLCHTFFYGSGGVDDGWTWYDNKTVIAELTPLFEKYDVDLVISGHKHQAEVLRRNDVTYVVAGTLGGEPDKILTYKSPASEWVRQGVLGYADVTINGSSAVVAFRDDREKVLYQTTVKR